MKHTPGVMLVALSNKINFSIHYVNDKLVKLTFQVESISGIVEVYGQATVFYYMDAAVRADIEIRKFQPGTRASIARGVCAELAEVETQIAKKIIAAINNSDCLLDGGYA